MKNHSIEWDHLHFLFEKNIQIGKHLADIFVNAFAHFLMIAEVSN